MADSVIIPLGELTPDAGSFGSSPSERLTRARNVVPAFGNYVSSPAWKTRTDPAIGRVRGLHAHSRGPGDYRVYYGTDLALFEVTPAGIPWPTTNVTRTVGGAYNTAGTGGDNGWQFISGGPNVVATNYVDDPQILVSGAVNFAKLAQSGGVNPGYDPKAKFCGIIRDNLFLANCNLSALYDGLSAGAQPNLVAWSQDGNFRQFGSFNANPEIIGSGYQQILNDYGEITGFVSAGAYGIVAQERALVRIDGPPYQFRSVVEGTGCRFPNSLEPFGGDVYGWGPAGPFVLRGGEGPVEYLGENAIVRTLIDNTTLFSPLDSVLPGIDRKHVSLAIDSTNRLLQFTFTSRGRRVTSGTGVEGDLSLWYNLGERRFSFADSVVPSGGVVPGALYLTNRTETTQTWLPGRDTVGVVHLIDDSGSVIETVGDLFYSPSLFTLQLSFAKPYIQLSADATTRITRVRPIFSTASGNGLSYSVTIQSKNKPYDTPTTCGPYTGQDTHGGVTTPTTVFADFHRIEWTIGAGEEDTTDMLELEALEVWITKGGRYAR